MRLTMPSQRSRHRPCNYDSIILWRASPTGQTWTTRRDFRSSRHRDHLSPGGLTATPIGGRHLASNAVTKNLGASSRRASLDLRPLTGGFFFTLGLTVIG